MRMIIKLVLCLVLVCWWYIIHRRSKKVDRSFWMYCSNCIVKWRPTAYGPPAPDDYYCPRCTSNTYVKWYVGFTVAEVPEFKERSNH